MQNMPPEQDQDIQRFFVFIGKIIQVIHTTQDFDKSYEELAPHADEGVAGVFPDIQENNRPHFFLTFVRAVWDQTPLASNNFRPSPLPKLQRNDPCFCGSGKKFKQCCISSAENPMPVDSNMVWLLLLDILSEEEITTALNANAIPLTALLRRAQMSNSNGHQEEVIKLLEPIYQSNLTSSNEELDQGVTILCNAYDQLSLIDKKTDFLEKLKNSGVKSLKCEAWQRLATIYLDQGKKERGWDALNKAREIAPENPDVDLLEVSMLMGDRNLEEAQARAQFILRKWKKSGIDFTPMIIEFMQGVATDPEGQLSNFFNE